MKNLTYDWQGYVVYDVASGNILAVYGDALMREAFNQRDKIAYDIPMARITVDRITCPTRPHVGDRLSLNQ